MSVEALKNGMNNVHADRVTRISAGVIATYGGSDWDAIRAALSRWEKQGFIRIWTDPEIASYEQTSVEMLSYITD